MSSSERGGRKTPKDTALVVNPRPCRCDSKWVRACQGCGQHNPRCGSDRLRGVVGRFEEGLRGGFKTHSPTVGILRVFGPLPEARALWDQVFGLHLLRGYAVRGGIFHSNSGRLVWESRF